MKQKPNRSTDIETRSFASELRNEGGENRQITGYAAVFEMRSENLGGFTEIIEKGAFDEALSVSDVRALFNHDDSLLLARTASGTLKLSVDDRGLKYSFEAPATQTGDDVLELIRRGDLSQSSFGFTIEEDEWDEDEETGAYTRTIKKVKRLYDVSPVTYPAYPDTSVAQKSLRSLKDSKEEKPEANTSPNNKAHELELLKIRASI